MPKAKVETWPQLWDLYLSVRPSEDGTKRIANITGFKGRKSQACPPRFSFTPGLHLAGLYQVEVKSKEQLIEKIAAAAKGWVEPFEWDPSLVALIEKQQASEVTVDTTMGVCPPKGAE